MLNLHHIHRLAVGCGLALVLLCSTGGAAMARPVDDTPAAVATPRQDLRSPDARDAAEAVLPRQDLRSPDARDANGFYRPIAPDPVTPAAPAVPTSGAGVDWPMILLATGGYLLAVVACAGAFAALRGGRRRVAA
jgi:hypothetical protein